MSNYLSCVCLYNVCIMFGECLFDMMFVSSLLYVCYVSLFTVCLLFVSNARTNIEQILDVCFEFEHAYLIHVCFMFASCLLCECVIIMNQPVTKLNKHKGLFDVCSN